MANAMRQISLVAVLVCLASFGCAENSEHYSNEGRRLVNIYTNPEVDQATKDNNLESLAKFYDEHGQHIDVPKEHQQRVNELVEKYKRINSSEVLIDGVPANGGWKASVLRHIVVEGAIQAVGAVVEHARSSSQGLQINQQVAIFGLLFLVASYMFRTKSM